jgi:hypothetical protein
LPRLIAVVPATFLFRPEQLPAINLGAMFLYPVMPDPYRSTDPQENYDH